MTVTMIVVGYLLVGIALVIFNRKMFDEVIFDTKFDIPYNVRGIYIVGCAIIFVVLSPIVALFEVLTKLKPKK